MAEENEKSEKKSSGSGNRRRGRRRYFRRKKSNSGDAPKDDNNAQKSGSGSQQRRSKAQKNRRRRRRSRSNRSSRSSSTQKLEIDYTPPESVFIYTHVLRPEQRDSYSFRSEISAGTGRTLDDFDIDLSLIFPDEAKQGETLVGVSDRSTESDVQPNNRNEDDPTVESEESQQMLDETAQANRFHSEDDTPSAFA